MEYVIFFLCVAVGVYLGVRKIIQTRNGVVPASPKKKDGDIYLYIDMH